MRHIPRTLPTSGLALIVSATLLLVVSIATSVKGVVNAGEETVEIVTTTTTPPIPPEPRPPSETRTHHPEPPPPAHPNSLPAPSGTGTFAMEDRFHNPIISGARYDSMPFVTPLNPAGPQETMTRWVDGLGVPPSQAEQGTTYVLGHAWAAAPLVFNPISEKATDTALHATPVAVESSAGTVTRRSTDIFNGSRITLKDEQGHARVWVVDDTWLVDKYEAINDTNLMDEDIPGRIILIACSVNGAQDLGYNVIVSGHLESP